MNSLQHLALVLIVACCHAFSTITFIPARTTSRCHAGHARNQNPAHFAVSDDEIPSMDWLTDSLVNNKEDERKNGDGVTIQDPRSDMADESPFVEEFDEDQALGDAPLPYTGISVADEMYKAQSEVFYSELVPVIKGLDEGIKVAQLVTTSTKGSFEPVRYLVGLSKVDDKKGKKSQSTATADFIMVDVPPFSKQLKTDMDNYLALNNGRLAGIIVTTRENIHYNESPGVYSMRRADLVKWTQTFPDMAVVAYRLDIPRDCQGLVTQRLDGYGPFALEETRSDDGTVTNFTFVETGRPLTYEEWDHDVAENVLAGIETPPDDANATQADDNAEDEQEDSYSAEAIRAREQGKRILAIYTPGRTYGSVSYIFPEVGLCASGFTIPVEDSRIDEDLGVTGAGPALDFRGYISTSRAGVARQMESARLLIETYVDRFTILLPSRGDPVFLEASTSKRRQMLLSIVKQYEKVGKIYEQLGITNGDDDELDI